MSASIACLPGGRTSRGTEFVVGEGAIVILGTAGTGKTQLAQAL